MISDIDVSTPGLDMEQLIEAMIQTEYEHFLAHFPWEAWLAGREIYYRIDMTVPQLVYTTEEPA